MQHREPELGSDENRRRRGTSSPCLSHAQPCPYHLVHTSSSRLLPVTTHITPVHGSHTSTGCGRPIRIEWSSSRGGRCAHSRPWTATRRRSAIERQYLTTSTKSRLETEPSPVGTHAIRIIGLNAAGSTQPNISCGR